MQSYQPTSKHTIISAKWVAAIQYYHPTATLAVPSLHGLGIMQSFQPTSYHAVPSPHGIGIMQSYQPTSYHAVPSPHGIGIMQFYQPTSYHAVRSGICSLINIHPNMAIPSAKWALLPCSTRYHPTSSHAIPSLHCLPPYPISPQNMQLSKNTKQPTNRSNAAPAVRSKKQPASIEESCLHTALQTNRNCLARYIPCPSQCTWAVS